MAGELTDLDKARKDLLWGMFTEIRTHSRHAEVLRANVVNFMIVVESVLIAVIANDRRITSSDFVLFSVRPRKSPPTTGRLCSPGTPVDVCVIAFCIKPPITTVSPARARIIVSVSRFSTTGAVMTPPLSV